MLNCLAIFAMILAFIQAPVPVPSKTTAGTGNGVRKHASENQRNSSRTTPAHPTFAPALEQHNSSNQAAGDHPQSVSVREFPAVSISKDWTDKVYWAFSGLLVIVGSFQAWFLYRTLGAVKEQADIAEKTARAAEKSADVANASIETLREIERAWIFEEIIFPNELPSQPISGDILVTVVVFKFWNYGKTPARVLGTSLHFHTVNGTLPKTPEYGIQPIHAGDGHMLASGKYISGSRWLEGQSVITPEERIAIRMGRMNLYAYGVIVYETLEKTSYTRFCYLWDEPTGFVTSDSVPAFRKGGPAEYNLVT